MYRNCSRFDMFYYSVLLADFTHILSVLRNCFGGNRAIAQVPGKLVWKYISINQSITESWYNNNNNTKHETPPCI